MKRFRSLATLLITAGLLLVPACDNNTPAAGDSGTGDPDLPGDGGGGDGGPGGDGEPLVTVYTSDNDLDGVRELFTLAASGRRLELARATGASVEVFAVSPDGRFVAFGAVGLGLHVTAVDSDAPVRLSPAGEFEILEIAWSPDGSKIAYRAEKDGATAQLFLAHADGSNHLGLSGTAGEVRDRIRWLPDGLRVAFRSDKRVAEQWELYTVLCDGTGEAQLSRTQAPPGTLRVVSYSVAPAGNRIAFRGDLEVAGEFELWVREAAGLAPAIRVSNEAGTGGSILPDDWKWRSDGRKLAYRRRVTATGLNALFCVNHDGTDATEVSGAMNDSVRTYEWAGNRIAFRDDDSVHTTDGATVIDLVAGTTVTAMRVSPTGNEVGYLAGSVSRPDLFVARTTGSIPALVATEVRTFAWIPAGSLALAAVPRGRFARQDGDLVGTFEYDAGTATTTILALMPTPRRTSHVEFDSAATPAALVPMGAADMRHLPVVGDFDGDGADDLGAWTPQGFVLDFEPAAAVATTTLWGFATHGLVRLENAAGVTFELDLDVFVDDVTGRLGIVAVDPARIGPGSTNCYEGAAPVGANTAGRVTAAAIQGKGFPAQGTLTTEKRTTLVDILFGAIDFGDANGEFDLCQVPNRAVIRGAAETVTVRDSPGGEAIVFQSELLLNELLGRDATGEWIEIRVYVPHTGATFDGWVEAADVEIGGDVMKLPVR